MRLFQKISLGRGGFATLGLAALLASCSSGGNTGTGTVLASLTGTSSAEASVTVHAGSCTVGNGAITLDGAITVDGIGAQLIFTNNRNQFTHESTADFAADLVIVPEGGSLSVPTLSTDGNTISDPYVWVRFVDDQGQALSDEVYLGHCSEGLSDAQVSLDLPAEAVVFDSTRASCSNHPGPEITLDAELSLGAATAQIVLRDRADPASDTGTPLQEAIFEQPVTTTGKTFPFPKQPVQGGVGGNPWIFLELSDGAGSAVGNRVLLGRCVQLEQGISGDNSNSNGTSADDSNDNNSNGVSADDSNDNNAGHSNDNNGADDSNDNM